MVRMENFRTLLPLFLLAFALPAAAVEPGAHLPDWYDVALSATEAARVGDTFEVRAVVAARALPLRAVVVTAEADSIYRAPAEPVGPFDLSPGQTRAVSFTMQCLEEGSRYVGIRLECDAPREELKKAVDAMNPDEPTRKELLRAVETVADGPRFRTERSVSVDVR